MPEVVPMSDKAIFSKMDLLLTKAELSTVLVHICDKILSLFLIIPLWPLIGSRLNFSSWVCFTCDGNRWRISLSLYLYAVSILLYFVPPSSWVIGWFGGHLVASWSQPTKWLMFTCLALPWWSWSVAQAWPGWKSQQLECNACSAFLPIVICLGGKKGHSH